MKYSLSSHRHSIKITYYFDFFSYLNYFKANDCVRFSENSKSMPTTNNSVKYTSNASSRPHSWPITIRILIRFEPIRHCRLQLGHRIKLTLYQSILAKRSMSRILKMFVISNCICFLVLQLLHFMSKQESSATTLEDDAVI